MAELLFVLFIYSIILIPPISLARNIKNFTASYKTNVSWLIVVFFIFNIQGSDWTSAGNMNSPLNWDWSNPTRIGEYLGMMIGLFGMGTLPMLTWFKIRNRPILKENN
jgi:hypothetical protein|tara:strand:- start:125 stop:448 length:324 start_codon:yes stop_codon:yes gene_type:complete